MYKKGKYKLDWLTLSCLVTKKSMTYQQGNLGSLLLTFMHQFEWWEFGGNSVYQRWTICPLKSESVLKCIFLGSGDPNFKISILGALHGGNLWDTDLANSTETQSLRKNGCRQKCLDESLITITLTNISIFLFNRSSSISASG